MDYETLQKHYTSFLSSRVADRKLRAFWSDALPAHVKPHPNPIELAAGMPNEGLFPIESLHVNVVDEPFAHEQYAVRARQLHRDGRGRGQGEDADAEFDSRAFVQDRLERGSLVDVWRYDPDRPAALSGAVAYQYAESRGQPQLLDFCRRIVQRINPPAYDQWDVTLAHGSSDSLFKIFETFCDAGVTVLAEEFTFTPTVSNIVAAGGTVVPVKVNVTQDAESQGIDVEFLADLLDNWASSRYAHLSKPRLLYTIPTGQNPTGTTLSQAKRRQIYDLANKHDFLIVEDDPYGYLKLPAFDRAHPDHNAYASDELSVDDYCDKVLSKSFITIDTVGRVLRLETFSKLFLPGVRISFIVANKFFIDRIVDFADVSVRAPNGIAQAVLVNVIHHWGTKYHDDLQGWLHWVMKVASQYTHRRNVLFQAFYSTDAYKKGLFTLTEPSAGMFLTLKPSFEKSGKFPLSERERALELFNYKLLEEGVKVVLGTKMIVCRELSLDRSFFLRITFAYAADDLQLQEAATRVSRAVERLFDEC